jgi:hypothetical protein
MSSRISNNVKTVVISSAPTPLPGGAQDTQVLTNINGQNIWSYPQYWIQGKNFIPSRTVDVSSIQQFDSTYKYSCAVLSNKGFIYCLPDTCNNVLIVNPYTNQVDNTTISNINLSTYPVIKNTDNMIAGAVTYNNNIYGIPLTSKAVMKVNTNTNTLSFIDVSNLADTAYNWYGGALSSNGLIYGMNYNNTKILRIDPLTDIVTKIDISGLAGSPPYYVGGVLAPNGRIYGVPHGASSVVVVNPETNTAIADISGLTGLGSGGSKWAGGVLAPNGKIYCMPFFSNNVLVIDTSSNTTSTIATGVSGQYKWAGGVLGLDGNIYGIPQKATSVLIIDPNTNTLNTTTITGLTFANEKWQGGVLAPNGKIYMTMSAYPTIGIIKTKLPTQEPWMMSPEFNKF